MHTLRHIYTDPNDHWYMEYQDAQGNIIHCPLISQSLHSAEAEARDLANHKGLFFWLVSNVH